MTGYDECSLPERRLMQAVILNAIADACGVASGRTPATIEADRRAAIKWIAEAGPDFEGVCELAGLSPETVRMLALAYVRSNEAFPRINRQSFTRRPHDPLAPAAVAARAGVSVSAVRGVLKHDVGSREMKALVRQTLQALADEQREAA